MRQVLRHRPGLLVAQSTPKGRPERWVRLHTDYRLIETCPCPVLFIKNNRPYSAPVVLAAVDPEHLHEKPASLVVRRESADIVTLGAVSRSRLARSLIGHTAERVFDAMDCDLLVVKPPEFLSRVRLDSVHGVERSAAG